MESRRVDLHVHSTASDGTQTPSELVRAALQRKLAAIALTDHDSTAGIAEASAAAANTDLEVIPGVEINSERAQGELHLLGYYVDPLHPGLRRRLQRMRRARLERGRAMLDRLAQMGMPLDWEEVLRIAGGESVGRPHVAQALVKRGYVSSLHEAFAQFLDRGGPAYVSRARLLPADAIQTIQAAAGVAVLAHPAQSRALDLVPELVAVGLQGLEVYYPTHSTQDVRQLTALCRHHGLLATGGSDYHGPGHSEGADLGAVHVPIEVVTRLRAASGQPGTLR